MGLLQQLFVLCTWLFTRALPLLAHRASPQHNLLKVNWFNRILIRLEAELLNSMNICERINSIRNSPLCLSGAASAQTTAGIVFSAFHATAPRQSRWAMIRVLNSKLCLCNSISKLMQIHIGVRAVGPCRSATWYARDGSDTTSSKKIEWSTHNYKSNIVQCESQTFAPCKTNRQKIISIWRLQVTWCRRDFFG